MNDPLDIKALATGVRDYTSADRAIALMQRRRKQHYVSVASAVTLVTLAAGGLVAGPGGGDGTPAAVAPPSDPCGSAPVKITAARTTALGGTVDVIRRQVGQQAMVTLADGRTVTDGAADSTAPDGSWIGRTGSDAYQVTNTLDGTSLQVRPCAVSQVAVLRAVAWSPDSRFLLISHVPTVDDELYLLELASGAQRRIQPPEGALPMTVLTTGQVVYALQRQDGPRQMAREIDLVRTGGDRIEVRPGSHLRSGEVLNTYEEGPRVLAAEDGGLWVVVYGPAAGDGGYGQRAVLRVTPDGTVAERRNLGPDDRVVGASPAGVLVAARDGAVHLIGAGSRSEVASAAPGDIVSAGGK
ncbi:hypothetical protein QLQ12_30970 [Actinoplanes sp. NEAU-A12]|uniref:Lipoprotein LpqB beta-propeller domain-containing protein n=1 Tax=Actinoplanes sandaracinus TaxID=3045177 RepID=A0ABT6WTG9_9ACTN|nr:hypothetical protein [Actinoplanes sandaracinus]MDI6103046.1 hypothetical protein [Actinoplanes sandaracinus]